MALDELAGDDAVVETNGIKFMMDAQTREIVQQSGGLNIDFIDESHRRGYMLKLGKPGADCSSGGCSGCG